MIYEKKIIETLVTELDEALFCERVWSAWGYGTMSENDFYNVAEDEQFIDDLAEKILKIKKGGTMKKTFKWLFIAPIVFFGVWLIALFCQDFREKLIDKTKKLLEITANEIERTL